MKWFSRFKISAWRSYGIFYLYYSNNDQDLFYRLHGAQKFSELICRKASIQKIVFRTHLGYYELLTMSFGATMPAVFMDLMSHGPCQPRQARVIFLPRELNQAWALLYTDA